MTFRAQNCGGGSKDLACFSESDRQTRVCRLVSQSPLRTDAFIHGGGTPEELMHLTSATILFP